LNAITFDAAWAILSFHKLLQYTTWSMIWVS
jgi:hypothetical protein